MSTGEGDPFTLALAVAETPGPARWTLPLRGRWDRSADDVLRSAVTGTLPGAAGTAAASGRIEFWPRRVFGAIIGPSRIVLDVRSSDGRLVLDGEVPPPPYLGISLPGRLITAGVAREVTVSIDPVQLVGLWLGLHRLLP